MGARPRHGGKKQPLVGHRGDRGYKAEPERRGRTKTARRVGERHGGGKSCGGVGVEADYFAPRSSREGLRGGWDNSIRGAPRVSKRGASELSWLRAEEWGKVRGGGVRRTRRRWIVIKSE